MSNSEEFQKIFLELIEDIDCKKSQLPKIIGIEYDVCTKIIEYGRIPKPIILMRIADFFDISIEYLLGRTDDKYFEKSKESKTFQERYQELKDFHHMKNYGVAKRLHIPTTYTTNWKKYNYIPSLDNLILLAEIFEVSLDYLLGRTDYKN